MGLIYNLKFILKDNKKEFFNMLIFHFCHSILMSIPTGLLVVIIFELFKKNPNQGFIWNLIILLVLLLALQLWLSAKAYTKASTITYKISKNLRMKLGNHLYKLGLGVFSKKNPSYFSSLLLEDVRSFENHFSHGIPNLISGFFSVIILFLFLFALNYKLAFFLLLGIICIIPFVFLAKLIIVKVGSKLIEKRGQISLRFLEYFDGMKYLKSFNVVDLKYNKLDNIFKEYKKLSFFVEILPSPIILVSLIFCELAFLFMVYNALEYYANNELLLPILISFLVIGYRVYDPIKLLMADFLQMQHMNSGLTRILKLLSYETIDNDHSGIMPASYDIKFNKVFFSYDNNKVFENLNLLFKENSITALVGYSGEGKSTIMSLLAKFWNVNKGEIKIGNVLLRDMSLHDLYTQISMIFQETYLFNDSIYNNIKIAKPKATKNEILLACEKAQCISFINNLQEGINTKVGEGGVKLSGGQKQRISIARALLKDAPIVLFDEATSALDPQNEFYIHQAMKELMKNKTVIIIAHKIANIKIANKIYVIANKKVAQEGTYSELIKQKGIFKEMLEYQEKNEGWKI